MKKTDAPEAVQPMPLADAINELQRGMRVFKAFEHAEALCVMLQGAEQLRRELDDENLKLVQRRNKLRAEGDSLTAANDKAKADTEKLIEEAQAKADSITTTAQSVADNLIAGGQNTADELLAEAQGKLDAIHEQIQTRNEANQALAVETADLERRATEAREYLANLKA